MDEVSTFQSVILMLFSAFDVFTKLLLLSAAAIAFAAPAKMGESMIAAEGQNLHSYAAPPPVVPKYGGGTVTSYNRRGSHAASDLAKPAFYGSSYAAPSVSSSYHAAPSVSSSYHAAPSVSSSYHSAPVGHAAAPRYPAPELSYDSRQSYGPQRNAFSEHSKQVSQDPHYDPAKDPVSQYSAYIPIREYSPQSHSHGNELSIYGYRK